MTTDEYWYDDPRLLDNYERMYEKKRNVDESNAWLSGAYVKSALSSSVFICSLYDKKMKDKIPKYPNSPTFEKRKNEIMSDDEIQHEREKLFSFLVGSSPKKGGVSFG